MRLLPKSIHRCRRYPTKFNSGRDIPQVTSPDAPTFQDRRDIIAYDLLEG